MNEARATPTRLASRVDFTIFAHEGVGPPLMARFCTVKHWHTALALGYARLRYCPMARTPMDRRQSRNATVISVSTAAPRGSSATPTATRAGIPASLPKTSASWFVQPSSTLANCRRARYRGTRKNLFDLRRAAVVHNLHVIARQPSASHYQLTA
jgi:hypothetical protein